MDYINYSDITELIREKSFSPPIIKAFLNSLIKKLKCKKVYIPYAQGEDVVICNENGVSVDYDNPYLKMKEYVEEISGIKAIKVPNLETEYDLIYSELPIEPVSNRSIYSSIVDDCNMLITKNNYAVFTFSSNITSSSNGQKWIKSLEKRELYLIAVIDLPSGIYAPYINCEGRILIFSRNKTDKVFLSKIKNDNDIDAIIENFIRKEANSKNERLGVWSSRDSFYDYAAFDNNNRNERLLDKLSKNFNGKLVPIQDISLKIDSPRKDGFNEEIEAAVYIPKLGKSKTVTRISDFDIKNHNYFRIIVNQDLIIPDYLAFVLNTESGIELRLRAMNGGTIPFLNASNVAEIRIPLPSIEFQSELLKVESELNQISSETAKLMERLRQTPAAYKSIRKEIKEINNQGDKFEQWLEKLPYPIATILKRYHVAGDDNRKQEMLLYFFEAYSIFESAILVGAYGKLAEVEKDICDVDAAFFEKASFGSWVKMNRAFSKSVRKQINNSETLDRIYDCFCTEDRSVINALCSNDVCNILQGACDNRNSWRGHSGITSDAIYTDHVRILENDLRRFQEKIQDTYEKLQLIRPLSLKHRDGVFINTVEVLEGSNPIFKKCDIIGNALDENKLYIRMVDTNRLFELPPFLVMKKTPSEVKNACYFYSRIEGNNTKYVSYHFEGNPEDIEEGSAAYTAIKKVLGSN